MRVAPLFVIAFALGMAQPSAQQSSVDEHTAHPYLLLHGGSDMVVRAERHERLAATAQAAGDHARAGRHLAEACYARSEYAFDVTLGASACQRARVIADTHGVVDVKVSLLTTEGNLRAWSLDVTGAVARLQEAIALGASLDPNDPTGSPVNDAHFALGAILIEAGHFDLAQQELTFARAHCTTASNDTCVAYAEVWLCRLHTQLGNFAAATAACDAAQTSEDAFVRMNLGWMRSGLETALGRHDASLAALQGAWRDAQIRGGELLWPTLMHSIADALVTLGRLDEAEVWQRQLEVATESGRLPASYAPQTWMRRGQIALARGSFPTAIDAFTKASNSPMHEMAIGADYGLAAARKANGDLPAARHALERAITRIEAGRTSVDGAELRASYLTLHAKAYRELIGIRFDSEGGEAAPAALAIAEAGRARALLDALASAQVVGAAAPTLDAAAVQATLAGDEVLVEYVSSEQRLLAITVTRDRIALHALPGAGTADELAKRVDFFSALVQETDEEARLNATARRLYNDVLAPALADVPAAARTLIIAADGPLHRLPFDALGDSPRLIDRWDVVTLPSASALANRTRATAPTSAALVVAAPAETAGLGPLTAAPAEAAAIRRRVGGEVAELSGAGATHEALEASGLGRFAVLHFASHALMDEARPLRSALMLAPGASDAEGRWSAEEIYRTSVSADLVVLSACRTGAGAQTPGEGVMSLARAFLYAGAGATVATLWDVPDAPSPIFADVLYRELAAGRQLSAAVAEARRELRRQGAPPRAWAAYVLTGNPRARVAVTPRASQWPAPLVAGLALVLAGIGAAVARSRSRRT